MERNRKRKPTFSYHKIYSAPDSEWDILSMVLWKSSDTYSFNSFQSGLYVVDFLLQLYQAAQETDTEQIKQKEQCYSAIQELCSRTYHWPIKSGIRPLAPATPDDSKWGRGGLLALCAAFCMRCKMRQTLLACGQIEDRDFPGKKRGGCPQNICPMSWAWPSSKEHITHGQLAIISWHITKDSSFRHMQYWGLRLSLHMILERLYY